VVQVWIPDLAELTAPPHADSRGLLPARGLSLRRARGSRLLQRLAAALQKLGIRHFAARPPGSLAGGGRGSTARARAPAQLAADAALQPRQGPGGRSQATAALSLLSPG